MRRFKVRACWRNRPETPVAIARRLKTLIGSLRGIAPQYARWYQVITEDNVPELDDPENWLVSAVASRIMTDDLGAPVPAFGYFLITMNSPPTYGPRRGNYFIQTHAGSVSGNASALHAGHDQDWDPALMSPSVVKQTILAFSQAFEPWWCEAGPLSLWKDMDMSRYKEGPVLTPWMIHLSAPLAQRITPPPDVTTERFSDGSLFLSVTDQTFDPENPEHVAAAHRLFAVLDPLQEKKPRSQWRR